MKHELESIIADIQRLIKGASTILITSHRDGDGDSIGTQLAVHDYITSLGKSAVCLQHGPIPSNLTFLPDSDRIVDVSSDSSQLPDATFDLVITLECPNLERAGAVSKIIDSTIPLINIDHHADNIEYGSVNWIDASASSVGEMVTYLFDCVKFEIKRKTAECLYTAILTDTGRFHYPSATPNTFRQVAKLVGAGIDIQRICDQVYFSRRPQSIKLTGLALARVDYAANERVCIIPISREMMNLAHASNGDTEGIVEYTLYGERSEIGALLRDNPEGGVKVSLRSRGASDVARIAREFGGGGHVNAAGCILDGNLETATDLIKSRLIKALGEEANEYRNR